MLTTPTATAPGSFYTDAEVDAMCDGLTQPAAMIRYLRGLGLRVDRKPNGRPLAWRPAPAPEVQNGPSDAAGVVVGLQSWSAGRKQRGQKTQGR
jgi:hypothetical protein